MLIFALILLIPITGFTVCSADIDLGGQKIINLATPTASSHAATKSYVDNIVANTTMNTSDEYCNLPDIVVTGY